MKLTAKQAKANFLDRKAVTDAIGKAKAKVLAKQGAYVRTVARRSMKKKKGASPVGSPPHVHEGQVKNFLYFAFDPVSKTVIVGPVKLGKGTAPETLEYGGKTEELGFYDRRGRFVPWRILPRKVRDAIRKAGRKLVTRLVKVAPRPYMNPALQKSASKLAAMWKDAVKR